MRLMEWIRRKGQTLLMAFIGIFVISIFAGLGVSNFSQFFGGGNRGQQQQVQSGRPVRLASEGEYKDAAMLVDGKPITDELFYATLTNVFSRARQESNDPAYQFQAYGQVAAYLLRQEMIISKATELGIKVTADDLREEKDKDCAQFMTVNAQEQTGNVVGDLAKKLGTRRDREKAFEEFLTRSSMTEEQWESETRRSILVRKTMDAVQEQLDAEKEIEATATKAKVDEELANGVAFADVVRKYSDDSRAADGGDLMTWLNRGLLFNEEAEDILFSTPKGEISEWIDIPAGFQRFEVYDKLEAEGPEFEEAKAGIIEAIKTDKGADYEPTEEEIAKKFEKVKARQLMIRTNEPGAAENHFSEVMKSVKVEINNPFILAYQAVYADRIQPPAGYDLEQLMTITQNAAVGEDFDYGLIEAKLVKGLPELPTAGDDEKPAAGASADEAGADETAEPPAGDTEPVENGDDATAPAVAGEETSTAEQQEGDKPAAVEGGDETPAAEEPAAIAGDEKSTEEEDETMRPDGTPVPIYALGIGLFKLGLQEQSNGNDSFAHYMMAKLYLDWLKDEDAYAQQPMDRPAAREEIESDLELVAKSYEYSPLVHANRGLNLAWLERPEEARESLELALKYAPKDDTSEAFAIIKDAYEVLDDTDKVAEIDAMLTQLRQERLQRQIEEAQARQQAQQQAPTPFSPGAGQPPAAGEDKSEAEDEADSGNGSAPAEAEESEPEAETPAEPAKEPSEEEPADE